MSKSRNKIIKLIVRKDQLGEPIYQVKMDLQKFQVRKETLLFNYISKYYPCFNLQCIRGVDKLSL